MTRRFAGSLVLLAAVGLVSSAHAQRRPAGAASTASSAGSPAESEELSLAIGENRTLPASDVKQYSEGAAGIAEIKLTTDNSQFVIVGQKAGRTTLLLIKKDGSSQTLVINVFARRPELVERELRELLEGSVGLRIRRVGARYFIEGGVTTEAELHRVQKISALYPGQVESLVEVGAAAAEKQFNIRIDFFFVQFNKNSGYNFGVFWPGQIGGAVVQSTLGYDFVGKVATSQASIVNQPLPGLDIAQTKGWAKVLKQATVITGNGSEASFDNGGEQNFPVTSGLTASIRAIEFGTNLKALPRYDATTGELEVKIDANVNDLTAPIAGTTLPGRNTTKLSTVVHLKLGQSIVLSGISTRSQRHDTQGLPLLSQIPILGFLFGSTRDQSADVEGSIFIVPSIVDTLPKASLALVNDAVTRYEEYSGKPLDRVEAYDRRPPAAVNGLMAPAPSAPRSPLEPTGRGKP